MEPWNKSNDEIFSNIFNGNIPSLIIRIDVTQLPESPSQNPESLQEVATSSVVTTLGKDKRLIHDDDLKNAIMESKRQIFESPSNSAECFQEVPVEFLPTVSAKKKILIDDEDVKNALKKIKHRILRSPQYTKYLQKIPIEFESNIFTEAQISLDDSEDALWKNDINQTPKTVPQTEILKDIYVEPESTLSKERLISHEHFKDIVPEIGLLEATETSHSGGNPTLELVCQNNKNFQEIHMETVANKRKIATPDEANEDSVKRMKWNLPELENLESKEEIPIRSVSTLLKETQIHLEDFNNIGGVMEFQLSVNDSDLCVEPKSTLSKESLISPEHFKNIVPELGLLEKTETSRTGGNPTLELPFQNSQNFQEIHMEPVAGKRKRATLDEAKEDSIKRMKWNSPELENIEPIQEIPIRSVSTLLKETQIHLEDFNNVGGVMEFQVSVNQIPEPLPQNSDYLRRVPDVPEFSLLNKTETIHENFKTIEKETKGQTGVNETLEWPFERTEDLQEISINSVTGKRKRQTFDEEGTYVANASKCEISEPPHQKTETLQEVSSESASATSKKKKRQILHADFKEDKMQISKKIVKKIKRQCWPELQISAPTVQIVNDFISHLLDIFDEELHGMKKVKKIKTLTETELELVMKLSLSKVRSAKPMEYGRVVVQTARRNVE